MWVIGKESLSTIEAWKPSSPPEHYVASSCLCSALIASHISHAPHRAEIRNQLKTSNGKAGTINLKFTAFLEQTFLCV